MNTKFYIRYETPVGQAWADRITGLNNYTVNGSAIDRNFVDIRSYEQQAAEYHRSDYKMQIFKTVGDGSYLSIGYPANIANQSVSIAAIDTTVIASILNNPNYKAAYFAFYSGEHPEGAGDLDAITKSSFYARNVSTGNLENVSTGAVISESNPSLSLWYLVEKIEGTNIYCLTANPQLVSVLQDVDGTSAGVDYRLISDNDVSFAKAFFNPSVDQNGKVLSDNIIFATGDVVVIDTLGNSVIHGFTGQKVPANELPAVNLVVDANVPTAVNNHVITIDLTGKSTAYVSYKWVTGTSLDAAFTTDTEALVRKFVIVK